MQTVHASPPTPIRNKFSVLVSEAEPSQELLLPKPDSSQQCFTNNYRMRLQPPVGEGRGKNSPPDGLKAHSEPCLEPQAGVANLPF